MVIFALIISLICLANPNLVAGVVDPLPDFIAFFIIARLLNRAADSAPYFEEARASSIKLAWISLAKIPATFLVFYIRMNNTSDHDIFPLVGLVFAVLEIIFSIGFINNIFSALFYLGERGGASALILPFPAALFGKRKMKPEDLKIFTIVFVVAKCALYALPEFLQLSAPTTDGTQGPSALLRYYPYAIVISVLIGLMIGAVWLFKAIKYTLAIAKEGKFSAALHELATAESEKTYETKRKLRKISSLLLFLVISSFLSFRIALEETNDINILPSFLFAAFLMIAVFTMRDFITKRALPVYITGGIYAFVSLISLILTVKFHADFDGYLDIGAKAGYIPVMVSSIIEFILLVILWIFAGRCIFSFIENNTGLLPSDARYGITEKSYHAGLKKRAFIMIAFSVATGLAKCIDICLNYGANQIFTDVNSSPEIVTEPALPWFSLVVITLAVINIGFTLYYTSTLKEECVMKYTK